MFIYTYMIINQFVNIDIKSGKSLSYYNSKDYKCNIGDIISVNVHDIPKSSRVIIKAECDYCGNIREISNKSYNDQTKNNKKYACSRKCSFLKSKETNKERYGVENVFQSEKIKEKSKKTNLERYGVENYRKSIEYNNSYKKTMIDKHGVDHYSKTDEFKKIFKNFDYDDIFDKVKKTNKKRYGVENYSKTEEFKQKLQKLYFTKFNFNIKEFGQLISSDNGKYEIKCNKCNKNFEILHTLLYTRKMNNMDICTNCNPKNEPIKQYEISNFLEEKVNIINNYKLPSNKEIDIYIPEYKLGIEFNGLYWHSELYKDKKYHINKTNECQENDIQLIHIWEDQWRDKQDIVKSIILNKIGQSNKIYARKCIVKEIKNTKLVSKFLEENHIQGKVGSKVKLGLFYKDELVSLMTFGSLRKNLGSESKEGSYELFRFCNKLNTTVIGGASKLFKYFVKKYKPNQVISYALRDYSNGNLYKKLGFELEYNTHPNYFYTKNGFRYNRFGFRKDILVKEGYDPIKTEHQIMLEREYYRIYDTGSYKFNISF